MAATKRNAGLTSAVPRATLNDEELVSLNVTNKSFVLSSTPAVWHCILTGLRCEVQRARGVRAECRCHWAGTFVVEPNAWVKGPKWACPLPRNTLPEHCNTSRQCFPTSFPWLNSKIIFRTPGNTYLWKQNQNKEAVGSARILVQCCQLPDKNSRCISKYIWNFLRYVTTCICLLYVFWRNL
jgi:hypothetical protein